MNQSGVDYSNTPSPSFLSASPDTYYSHFLKNSRSPSKSPSRHPETPDDSMMDSFYTKTNDKSVDFLLNEPLDSSRRTSINTMSPMPMLLSPNIADGPTVRMKGGRQIKMLNTSKMLVNPLDNRKEADPPQAIEVIIPKMPEKAETETKEKRKRAISFGLEITNVEQGPNKTKQPAHTRVFQNLMQEDLEKRPQQQQSGYKRNLDMQNLQIKALPSFRSGTDSLTRPYPVLHKGQSIGFENNNNNINTYESPYVQNNANIAQIVPSDSMSSSHNSNVSGNIPGRQRSRTREIERLASQLPSSRNQEPSIQEEDTPETQEKKRILKQILSKIALYKIRRALVVCITIFIAGWLLAPLIDGTNTSHRSIFALVYAFLGYYLIENIVRAVMTDIIPWKKVENVFDAVDVFVLIIFVLAVDLKLNGINLTTKYIFFIPLASVSAYFCKSKAPRALKESQTAIRCLFAIQIVLIAGKIDGDLDWPWRAVLSFVWLFFGLIGVYCIVVGFTLMGIIAFAILKLRMYQNIKRATQILGFLWSTLYSGIGIILFLALIGVSTAYDQNNDDKGPNRGPPVRPDTSFLKASLDAAQYLSLSVAVVTLLCYRWVSDFLVKFNLDDPDYRLQLGLRSNENNRSRVIKESKITYLVQLSSTYFSFLHKSFAIKAGDLRNLKRAIKKARGRKLNMKYGDEKKSQNSPKKDTHREKPFMSIETLKKEKQNLDAVYGKQNSQIEIVVGLMELQNPTRKKQRRLSLNNLRSSQNHFNILSRQESIMSNNFSSSGKVCLSEGDRDYAGTPMRRNTIAARNRDNQCYICCDKPPNAVMVECGHGGVCVDCAVETIQARGQCMECRMDVRKIIKIDIDPKFKDIVKGYETITVNPVSPSRRREGNA